MELIRCEITNADCSKPRIEICVDRLTLAKRRWRGVAQDGADFGFDLLQPLRHGAVVFETNSGAYVITQNTEPVLELTVNDSDCAARLGWMIGNLHFPIETAAGRIRAPDDPAMRRLLERENISFGVAQLTFQPCKAAVHHEH